MGDVLQFRRKPSVKHTARGFQIHIDPDPLKAKVQADRWGIRDRGGYRIAPHRDGTVALEIAHPGGGAVGLTLSVEDAEQLRTDLMIAAQGAERIRQKARGACVWRVEPAEGGAFRVSWNDKTALFVETKVRRERRCWRCAARMPAGTLMYRQEGRGSHRWRGGSEVHPCGAILDDAGYRICRACMSPVVKEEPQATSA